VVECVGGWNVRHVHGERDGKVERVVRGFVDRDKFMPAERAINFASLGGFKVLTSPMRIYLSLLHALEP
jgi:hypothetical protein